MKETIRTATTVSAEILRRCATPGRENARKLVAVIRALATMKHNSEVIELAIQKSHVTMARAAP